ncbi:efflux RND transporter periplasmic adaptor subunit [Marinitoga sp. 1138]|uniref:efflux RND transporter periplasmic adaptor subunit n=1 Tax=Marinitoga sp. 1138 TaxID=1643334 RepID=UPI0015861EA6|nr:HlyD family efflux transporter periplasmic adaptor subunit [Marinitoga sp. 1138]NUU97903.1 hypothetical protein [Marinitoga sp. 1138]
MKRKIIVISIILALIMILISCNANKAFSNINNEIEYVVKKGDLTEFINVDGYVYPENFYIIYSKIGGEVKEIFTKNGQYLRKGDKILKVDDLDYKISMLNAQLAYEEVKGTNTLEEKIKKLSYEKAKLNYENTLIKAPINGIIFGLNVRKGDILPSQQKLCIIADDSTLEFIGYIDIFDYNKIKLNQKIKLKINGLSGEYFEGVISYISPGTVEKGSSNKVKIKAKIITKNSDKHKKIYFGATAEGEITTLNLTDIIKIPSDAVIFENEKTYVKIKNGVDENGNPKIEKKEIKIGLITDDFIEVKEGLKDGDTIMIKAADKNLSIF